MPIDSSVAEGDTAVLKCLPPKGNPRPAVRWQKNGDYSIHTDLIGSERFTVTETGNLVIRDVEASDAAEYVCQAENMVGRRDSEPALLKVLGNVTTVISVIKW